MIKYTTILDKLSASLDFLEPGNDDILEVAEEDIRLTKDVLMEIRKDVISNKFDSDTDEIYLLNKLKLKYRVNFSNIEYL